MTTLKTFQTDPFLTRIQSIMSKFAASQASNGLKSEIFSEVQKYSLTVDEQEGISNIFLKTCDLMLDCQSGKITDNSFMVIMANLVHEQTHLETPSDDEIQKLTGLSISEIDQARASIEGQECLLSVIPNNPRGRLAKKPSGNKVVQSEEIELNEVE